MKNTKKPLFILAILSALLLCGCELGSDNAGDLKDVELIEVLAVDKTTDGISAEVQLLHRDRALERQYAESYYQLTGVGGDLAAAVGQLYVMGARQLNFSHAVELVIGEAAADPAIWLDYAVLSAQIRPTIYPVIAGGSAADLLAAGDAVLSPAYLLDNALEPLGSGYAGARAVSLQEFLTALCQQGIAPALPYAVKADTVRLAGLAVYDGAGWQIIEEGGAALAWRLLIHPKHIGGEVISLDKEVSLSLTGADIRRAVSEDGVSLAVRLQGDILSNRQKISTAEIEQMLCRHIEEALQAGLAESRALKLDFLGLGRELWRRQPAVWQQLAGGDYLAGLAVDFAVSAQIEREQV